MFKLVRKGQRSREVLTTENVIDDADPSYDEKLRKGNYVLILSSRI